MSAMGSVITVRNPSSIYRFIDLPISLPTPLDDAGDLAAQRQLAEAEPAERELAQVSARSAALAAPVPAPDAELRSLLVLHTLRGRRHTVPSFVGLRPDS